MNPTWTGAPLTHGPQICPHCGTTGTLRTAPPVTFSLYTHWRHSFKPPEISGSATKPEVTRDLLMHRPHAMCHKSGNCWPHTGLSCKLARSPWLSILRKELPVLPRLMETAPHNLGKYTEISSLHDRAKWNPPGIPHLQKRVAFSAFTLFARCHQWWSWSSLSCDPWLNGKAFGNNWLKSKGNMYSLSAPLCTVELEQEVSKKHGTQGPAQLMKFQAFVLGLDSLANKSSNLKLMTDPLAIANDLAIWYNQWQHGVGIKLRPSSSPRIRDESRQLRLGDIIT